MKTMGFGVFAFCALACVSGMWMARAGEEAAQADEAFAQLKDYDYGREAKPLRSLERMIGKATNDPQEKAKIAERLAGILVDAHASDGAKLFCCQQLHFVGSDAQLPLLTKMLDDPKTAEMARGALEGLGSEGGRAALRAAMERAQGGAAASLAASLGALRDEKSVEALAKLLGSPDAVTARCAAQALGKIGNAQAAAALTQAKATTKAPATDFIDAELCCAERLAAKDAPGAGKIYEQLWAKDSPPLARVAALRGLVKTRQAAALPIVMEAMSTQEPGLQAVATSLLQQVPGPKATAVMETLLENLKGPALAAMVDALGERGDKSARDSVAGLLETKDEAVRIAAVKALGKLGDASSVDVLAGIAGSQGAPAGVARASLARLDAPRVDATIISAAGKAAPATRAALIHAAADRRITDATPALLQAAGDADQTVRLAAVEAMTVIGNLECYPKLIEMVLSGAAPDEPAEKALLAVAGRLPDLAARVAPVKSALTSAKPAAKALFLRVLRGLGGAEALGAVRAALADGDATVRDAAVRALADWSDEAPVEDLLKLIKEAPAETHRVLALRGYLRLARSTKGGPAQQLRLLQQVQQVIVTPEGKKMLLAGLADIPEAGAMQVAGSMLGEQAVQGEAKLAVLKIAGGLARTNQAAAREAVDKLLATSTDKAFADQLNASLEKANRPEVEEAAALKHDEKRSAEFKKALAKRAPQGFHLACYLDCGADDVDGAKGGAVLKVGKARAHFWPESDRAAHFRFGTVWFDGGEVPFEATGLDAKKAYQLGFSWWDFDGNGRVQSVWLAPGKSGEFKRALKSTKLPDFKNAQEMPAEFTLPVSPSLYADGSLRIAFRQDGPNNAVVSEIWLWEGGEGSAKEVPLEKLEETKGPQAAPANTPVEIRKGQAEAGRTTNILIVTGIDYPGHIWKETCPAVAAELSKDKRLRVDVAEDPRILCQPEIQDYAALVIHFMNWEKPDPGEQAHANLKAFVEGGKGMVMLHFACGAFQDVQPWPEFPKMAGRVYDRKLRPHDPYGKFEVRMSGVKHPITEGLQPFETTDELYTCLAGDTPITVLAIATSKVDKKDYPMAFVLDYGKGRVFHTVLGHDAQAFRNAGVAELIRRATAWTAGLKPSGE